MIQNFNDGLPDVIVANVTTVKVDINLSHSDTLIFVENRISGEARIQAEERCTVCGKGAVEILDFVVTDPADHGPLGELDDAVLQAVREKKDFNAATLQKG